MLLRKSPVLCNYYLTYRCNARCGFCDIWEKPSPYAKLEVVAENLKALKRLGVQVIDFTGGEPLLHRHLPELLNLAKSLGFITTVTTNCLLYPKQAERLRGLVDMLHFSLDAWDAELHDKMRGVACYDFVMRSVSLALSLGERPDILFTAFNHNLAQIPLIYEQLCLPHRLMLIINPVFDYGEVETGGGLEQKYFPLLRAWARKPLVYLNDAFLALREEGGNHIDRPVCYAGTSTVVVSPENSLVLPCYHLGADFFPLDGKQLDEVWHTEPAQRAIAQQGRLPQCEGCAVNCYMQPSFAVKLNRFWWKALPGTLKYNLEKGTWKKLLRA